MLTQRLSSGLLTSKHTLVRPDELLASVRGPFLTSTNFINEIIKLINRKLKQEVNVSMLELAQNIREQISRFHKLLRYNIHHQ